MEPAARFAVRAVVETAAGAAIPILVHDAERCARIRANFFRGVLFQLLPAVGWVCSPMRQPFRLHREKACSAQWNNADAVFVSKSIDASHGVLFRVSRVDGIADSNRLAVGVKRQLHVRVVVLAAAQSLAQTGVGIFQALDFRFHRGVVGHKGLKLARNVSVFLAERLDYSRLLSDALDALFRDSHLLRLLFDTRELLGAGE